MKKIIFAIFLCISSISYAEYIEAKLCYVMEAKDGHIKKEKDTYILTLYDIDHSTTFMTDRPQRKAGKILTKKFFSTWDDNFKKVPPNAILVIETKEASFSQMPVILTNPKYDDQQRRLTFIAKPLTKGQVLPEGNTGEVTIFIDSEVQNILAHKP